MRTMAPLFSTSHDLTSATPMARAELRNTSQSPVNGMGKATVVCGVRRAVDRAFIVGVQGLAHPGLAKTDETRVQECEFTPDQMMAMRLMRALPTPLQAPAVARALSWAESRVRYYLRHFAAKGRLALIGGGRSRGYVWVEVVDQEKSA